MIDCRDSLRRLLPFHIRKQAHPASRQDVEILLEAGRLTDINKRLRVALMWWALGRWADASRLWCSDLSPLGKGWWRLRWRLTKTSQKGTFRLVMIRLPLHLSVELRTLWAQRMSMSPRATLFPYLSYQAFMRWMKIMRPLLSSHSFRRGGIQTALDAGAKDTDVQAVSGHKTVESMLTYADRLGRKAQKSMLRMAEALA
jgi:hypothetical protein